MSMLSFTLRKSLSLYKSCSKRIGISKSSEEVFLLEPEDPNKVTLVLDLDETLVHSSFTPGENNDLVLYIGGNLIYISKRPHLNWFLDKIALHFEVVIFTAGIKPYASKVINNICKHIKLAGCFYRQHCTKSKENYIKDLRILNRSLNKVVIVDDSSISFALQPSNGVLIKAYHGEKTDSELLRVWELLKRFKRTDNVQIALAAINLNKPVLNSETLRLFAFFIKRTCFPLGKATLSDYLAISN